jgi:hypothetical protein
MVRPHVRGPVKIVTAVDWQEKNDYLDDLGARIYYSKCQSVIQYSCPVLSRSM